MSLACTAFRALTALIVATAATAAFADSPMLHENNAGLDNPPDSLNELNNQFRAIYANAKKEFESRPDPTIILVGGKVVYIHNGARKESGYVPANWSLLKTFDHVPLAIFVALVNHVDTTLSSEQLEALTKLRRLVGPAQRASAGADLPKSIAARQTNILNESLSFLDKVVTAKQVSAQELKEFTRGMAKQTLANGYDATSIELASLDKVVQSIRRELTPEEWAQLHVVIVGSHMARQQERNLQYFSELLNEKGEGKRIVFLEDSDSIDKAQDLLATHELDGQIGDYFFADSMRMHRDFLSDGARQYLEEHPAH